MVGCCHYFGATEGGADSFTIEMSRITFGRGTMDEVGERARNQGIKRAALFTDPYLADSEHLARARNALTNAGVDVELYAEVRIEPTDVSVLAAADFLKDSDFDGVVSVGGGSVIDTAKGAMVTHSTQPASRLTSRHQQATANRYQDRSNRTSLVQPAVAPDPRQPGFP